MLDLILVLLPASSIELELAKHKAYGIIHIYDAPLNASFRDYTFRTNPEAEPDKPAIFDVDNQDPSPEELKLSVFNFSVWLRSLTGTKASPVPNDCRTITEAIISYHINKFSKLHGVSTLQPTFVLPTHRLHKMWMSKVLRVNADIRTPPYVLPPRLTSVLYSDFLEYSNAVVL